ncbi:hypothetical protein [Leuconostoc mesenteroides]|uniref:hypothetical protein n=1 Tax=Leuconostoc mesenteroides TaxID=1245 RepID=UPI0011447F21|nr:hypothetical protein [Leuconostoc mesenteroides]GEA91378.1 hypothetical protein LME01_11140 [Leuconostoc mesenteroides subsp. mesenteroides]
MDKVEEIEETKQIDKVFVFRTNQSNFDVSKLDIDDDGLKSLSQRTEFPDSNRVKLLNMEELENRKSYKLLNNQRDSYQLKKLRDLMNTLIETDESIELLKKFSDLYDQTQKELKYNAVAYFYHSHHNNSEQFQLSIFNLKKSQILSNKELLMFNKIKIADTQIDPVTGVREIELLSIDDGINLPESDCVSTFSLKNIDNQGANTESGEMETEKEVVSGTIFDAIKFDDLFNDFGIKRKYADNVLKKFQKKKFKLTADEINVQIENSEKVLSNISDNTKLLDAFANFRGSARSTINKVSLVELKAVLVTLKKYITNDAESTTYTAINVPEMSDDDKIILTEHSVAIFAALLENKVIERLLTHEINIPYL